MIQATSPLRGGCLRRARNVREVIIPASSDCRSISEDGASLFAYVAHELRGSRRTKPYRKTDSRRVEHFDLCDESTLAAIFSGIDDAAVFTEDQVLSYVEQQMDEYQFAVAMACHPTFFPCWINGSVKVVKVNTHDVRTFAVRVFELNCEYVWQRFPQYRVAKLALP